MTMPSENMLTTVKAHSLFDRPMIKHFEQAIDSAQVEETPSKEEILEEMELHNNDEVGINNQWDYEEAEYHLLLSDKYHNKHTKTTGS